MKSFDRRFPAFLVVGGINTLTSYIVYVACLQAVSYNAAYSVAFVFGVLLSYFLNSRFVFRQPISITTLIKYPSVYLVQYILGIVVLYIGVELLDLNPTYVPLVTVCISIPVTFLMTRFILK